MDFYCGTDIIEVDRVKDAILNTKGFRERVYTKNEIEYAENKGEIVKYEHYAGRFAAKEAVYKAMSKIDNSISWKQIEILNDTNNKGRPFVNIYDNQGNVRKDVNKIDVSISHIKEFAIANAVVSIDNK